MAEMDYAAVLPLLPTEEEQKWAYARACKREYLIYRDEIYTDPLTGTKTHGARVACSKCGQGAIWPKVDAGVCHNAYARAPFGVDFGPELQLMSGDHKTCPECGAECELRHIGNMRSGINQEGWFVSVGRFKEKLVLYGWVVQRHIDKFGSNTWNINPYEAYVVEQRSIVRLVAYKKVMTRVHLLGHWEQRVKYIDSWGGAYTIAPWDERLLIGSTAENSKLDLYLQTNAELHPVSYLKLWQRHKNAEHLLMQGAGDLLAEMIESERRSYYYNTKPGVPQLSEIDWKQKRPSQMLGLSRTEFRHTVQAKWKVRELRCYKALREMEGIRPEDMELVMEFGADTVHRFANTERRDKILKILRYLKRQGRDIQYLRDYWRMAGACGWNLEDESLRLPRDLARQHDKALEEETAIKTADKLKRRAKEIEGRREAFAKRAEEMEAFSWERGGILIRPVRTEEELIAEGQYLSHCVGGYGAQIVGGGSWIFFLRRSEAPDTPWYTLQLGKDLTVRQNRGRKNCDRTEEVEAFEEAWLSHIRQIVNRKESAA